jgi:hypothetical protein
LITCLLASRLRENSEHKSSGMCHFQTKLYSPEGRYIARVLVGPNFRTNCCKYLIRSQGYNKSNEIGRWALRLCIRLNLAVSTQHSKAKLGRLVSFNIFLRGTANINVLHKSLPLVLYLHSRLQRKRTSEWSYLTLSATILSR